MKLVDSSGFDYAGINYSKLNIHGILDVTVNLGKGPRHIQLYVEEDKTMKSSVVWFHDALKKFELRSIESPDSVEEATQVFVYAIRP